MNWPIAPILLPLFTALATLFWGRPGAADTSGNGAVTVLALLRLLVFGNRT